MTRTARVAHARPASPARRPPRLTTPYHDCLPPLALDEVEALRASIRADGVRHPILVTEDGEVLDGHHRLQLAPDAPRHVVRGLSPAKRQAAVFRLNLTRRHLSPEQKREAVARMRRVARALKQEDPKRNTQARIARALGVSRQTVTAWLTGSTASAGHASGRFDARVKVPHPARAQVARRLAAGERPAQVAADLGVTERRVRQIAATAAARTAQDERLRTLAAQAGGLAEDLGVVEGDFRAVAPQILDGAVSLIFTDPPYTREGLPLFADLARVAARVLVPGGSCVVYAPQYVLPEVLAAMVPPLRWWWVLALHYRSGPWAEMRAYGVQVHWMPLLWLRREGPRRHGVLTDWVTAGLVDKTLHPWQKGQTEARVVIAKLTRPGELVLDPFAGVGTTALAAQALGRRWLMIEQDPTRARAIRARLGGPPEAEGGRTSATPRGVA